MAVKSICGIVLASDDPAGLARFYSAALGLEFEREDHGGLAEHFGVDVGKAHFGIHPPANLARTSAGNASVSVAFDVDSLDDVRERIGRLGAPEIIAPHDEGFGVTATFADPDGNLFEVVELRYDFGSPANAPAERSDAAGAETNSAADVSWRLRLRASPARVFKLLTTDEGRASFWAERTEQRGDHVIFRFPNGETLKSRVLESKPPRRFALTYFDGSRLVFELGETDGGTDLRLHEFGLPAVSVGENRAGWVSVLMNLKAQADHDVDLRNHDPSATWSSGYVDN